MQDSKHNMKSLRRLRLEFFFKQEKLIPEIISCWHVTPLEELL